MGGEPTSRVPNGRELIDIRTKYAFLALIVTQAIHSAEEYLSHLYEVLPPARFASELVSNDLATGFLILNVLLILFGIWCYIARVRKNHPSAKFWIWPWIIIELGNGIAHPVLAILRGGYFPGVITAPILLLIAIYLAVKMQHR